MIIPIPPRASEKLHFKIVKLHKHVNKISMPNISGQDIKIFFRTLNNLRSQVKSHFKKGSSINILNPDTPLRKLSLKNDEDPKNICSENMSLKSRKILKNSNSKSQTKINESFNDIDKNSNNKNDNFSQEENKNDLIDDKIRVVDDREKRITKWINKLEEIKDKQAKKEIFKNLKEKNQKIIEEERIVNHLNWIDRFYYSCLQKDCIGENQNMKRCKDALKNDKFNCGGCGKEPFKDEVHICKGANLYKKLYQKVKNINLKEEVLKLDNELYNDIYGIKKEEEPKVITEDQENEEEEKENEDEESYDYDDNFYDEYSYYSGYSEYNEEEECENDEEDYEESSRKNEEKLLPKKENGRGKFDSSLKI